MKFKQLSFLALAFLSFDCFASYNFDPAKAFNPMPDKDDLIVSLPCDQKMVFRKVYTIAHDKSKITDKEFAAGTNIADDDHSLAVSQMKNKQYIQGSFKDDQGYYYLVGKYELMSFQYDAIMATSNEQCPKEIDEESALPKVNLSWFDAIDVTRKLSEFLQKNNDTPKMGNVKAYARLLSESEWEYAARGGLAVSDSEFDQKYPTSKDQDATIDLFAWTQKSSKGHLHIPGMLEPNALKLYDMLGNADEIVLDSFRATRSGRLHGQTGGFITRGGGYTSNGNKLSNSTRTERNLYSHNKENRGKDFGTRLTLSVPVAIDLNEQKSMAEEILKLGTSENTGKADGAKDDSMRRLAELKANEAIKNSEELTRQLADLQDQMINANTERDEMRDIGVQTVLRTGGFLCRNLVQEKQLVALFDGYAKTFAEACEEDESYCTLGKIFAEQKENTDHNLSALAKFFGDSLAVATRTYDLKLFSEQLETVKQGIGDSKAMKTFVDIYLNELKAYPKLDQDQEKNQQRWINKCYEILK